MGSILWFFFLFRGRGRRILFYDMIGQYSIKNVGNICLFNHIDGLVQKRRNPSALAMELCLSCTNPSLWRYACWWYINGKKWNNDSDVMCIVYRESLITVAAEGLAPLGARSLTDTVISDSLNHRNDGRWCLVLSIMFWIFPSHATHATSWYSD